MKHFYVIAILYIAAFPLYISANNNIRLDKKIEFIKDINAGMDSLFKWSNETQDSEWEIILDDKLETFAKKTGKEEYLIYALCDKLRCQYNMNYPQETIIASYKKIENLKLKTTQYKKALIDAKYLMALEYIYCTDFVKVFDIANDLLIKFNDDQYGMMKAYEILSYFYSEQFQGKQALEYAIKAYNISNKIVKNRNKKIAQSLLVCNYLNNIDKNKDNKPYLNNIAKLIKEGEACDTNCVSNYYKSMFHAYSIGYYLDKDQLDKAKLHLEEAWKNDVQLDRVDTRIRQLMTARYYRAISQPQKAWSYICEKDSIAPLLYLKEQAKTLHMLNRDEEAYYMEKYISDRIEWAFDQSFSTQITDMEIKYKTFAIQKEKSNILKSSIMATWFFIIIFTILIATICYRQRKYNKKIERANNTQRIFLQNMSHELRTPLNVICGFSQLVTNPDIRIYISKEEIIQYGKIIKSNTDMLSTLVNDILDASDMESGTYRINMDFCHPNEICYNAITAVIDRCPDNVKLYYTTEIEDNFTIYSDAQRVLQIITNFLTNAIKYTTVGTIHIHCSTSENPGKLTFSVTDTGIGVPTDKAELIFGRFEKLNPFKQGTGLGLAICRQLATLLNGSMKLDTSYINGARFVFIHPLNSNNTVNT